MAVARAFDVTPGPGVGPHRGTPRTGQCRPGSRPSTDVGSRSRSGRKSGQIVPATSGDRRYTTTELLAAEERIVSSAVERIADRTAQVAAALVDQVMSRHPHLDGEQADGVQAIAHLGQRLRPGGWSGRNG